MVLREEWQDLFTIMLKQITNRRSIMMKQNKVRTLFINWQSIMYEQLHCRGFEHVEDVSMFTPNFFINYDKNSDFYYTLLADVNYPEYLKPSRKDLPFLPEKRN